MCAQVLDVAESNNLSRRRVLSFHDLLGSFVNDAENDGRDGREQARAGLDEQDYADQQVIGNAPRCYAENGLNNLTQSKQTPLIAADLSHATFAHISLCLTLQYSDILQLTNAN